jgi:hypothetical protein
VSSRLTFACSHRPLTQMLLTIGAIFGLFLIVLPVVQTAPITYYVSLAGSDSNNGLSLSTSFHTIQKCAQVATAGDTCLIRAGVYREMVTPANSGTAGSPITFKPYNGESVTISGADVLTDWTLHTGYIYRTSLPWNLNVRNDSQVTSNQIFVDGQMMPEARWPNIPVDHLTRLKNTDKAQADSATVINTYTATYHDAALNAFPADFWKGGKINFGPGWSVVHTTCDVTGSTSSSVSFQCNADPGAGNVRSEWTDSTLRPSTANYYYLWGKYEALDAPGEWFRDNTGNLYLWTPDSASPDTHLVEAKRRLWAFDLSGKSHITLDGLDISAATIKTNSQTHHVILQNLDMHYLWHFQEIPPLYLTDGTQGINFQGDDNILRDSHLADTAGAMLWLSGNRNQALNNVIEGAAYMGSIPAVYGSASHPGGSNSNSLRQNTLFDSGNYMVAADPGLDIKSNDLYNSHLQIMDLGTIYNWGTDGRDAEIAYNLVHDNWAEYDWVLNYYGGHGIYLDDDTYNYKVYRNVIWNTTSPGIFLYGTNGTHLPDPKPSPTAPSNRYVYNNTVDGQLAASAKSNSGGLPQTLNGTCIRNNIASAAGLADPTLTTGNNYVGDGLYLDRDNRDYRLRADSPAVDAGLNLGSPYMDSPMTPIGAPDIGAYEYGQPPFVAGAVVRLQDLAQLDISCAANTGPTADCTVSNLPRGRRLPNDFQIRVGTFGAPVQNCLTRMNYAVHTGIGLCKSLSTAGLSGVQPIWIQLGTSGWLTTRATADLGSLAITAIDPPSGPDSGGTSVTITGRRFDTAFAGYRAPLAVTNATAARLYSYQVLVTLNTQTLIAAGKMRSDCGDLRFNDAYGNLDYWLEDGCGTANTRVWVRVPYIPPGASQIEMTYGWPGRASGSDGRRTFAFFDDFDDGVLNTNYWWVDSGAGYSVAEDLGVMRVAGTTTTNNQNGTFGFGFKSDNPVFPASFAIDAELTIVPPSSSATFKAGIGSTDLSLYGGGSGAFKDIGFWQSGLGWTSFGKSTINTALLDKKKLGVAYTGPADNRTVRWIEDGNLTTPRATRTGVSSPSVGYFYYSPDDVAGFDARFDNIRLRNYTYPEPAATVGAETVSGVRVTLGGQPCVNISAASGAALTCTTPAHPAGAVNVVITNPDGQSFTLPDGFTYGEFSWYVFLPLVRR